MKDFLPNEGDLQLTAINKSIAIDLLVNVVSLVKFERHDPLRMIDIDYDNQKYG